MSAAAYGGHPDIVRLMPDQSMNAAAHNRHLDIVRLMLNYGATNYDKAMSLAARSGQLDIVRLMLHHGATNYDQAMSLAACYDHKEVILLLLGYHPNTTIDIEYINKLKKAHLAFRRFHQIYRQRRLSRARKSIRFLKAELEAVYYSPYQLSYLFSDQVAEVASSYDSIRQAVKSIRPVLHLLYT